MQNKLNINDWSSVQSLFDKLNKQMEKTLKAADSLGAPRVYIKMLVELEVQPHSCSLLCYHYQLPGQLMHILDSGLQRWCCSLLLCMGREAFQAAFRS